MKCTYSFPEFHRVRRVIPSLPAATPLATPRIPALRKLQALYLDRYAPASPETLVNEYAGEEADATRRDDGAARGTE